ncbi:MAG TPA: hypothetical protein VEY51_17450 [Chondromyces sp.]|nr:hypothetical protein [Chondromyces sp.]
MYSERELKLSDFICNDRFELGSYLSYMFQQFYGNALDHPENKNVEQLLSNKVKVS